MRLRETLQLADGARVQRRNMDEAHSVDFSAGSWRLLDGCCARYFVDADAEHAASNGTCQTLDPLDRGRRSRSYRSYRVAMAWASAISSADRIEY